MSHKPPVPPASQAPYPPHPAPLPESGSEASGPPETAAEVRAAAGEARRAITGRDIAVGAAVGIGSAAITAALLFAGGRRRS